MREEFLDPAPTDEREQAEDASLRPRRLEEFVGQTELKEHLSVVLEAAAADAGPGASLETLVRAALRKLAP